ncbi:hypothetical protein EG68_09371 [Paragonimus skrjabini miyazakii]|uniref:DNA-directed RNA polymerase RpoA/D/Rpb3-type domain-containing protein n=1 Tax=Paragonimus skrjabini miyazakii TaxID=59628 RepID=A0A8S9YEM6_9TREM|nr:hypothetical protein EG68_09371 [Paragonimus skrjabini miyazakii]
MVDIFNQSPVYELQEHGIITHPGIEESWSIEKFRENLRVFISNLSETLEFDLINIDCSFANAIRRILIAEVPSVSIERVYLRQNTSIMPDEVLCHRLGLIPLTVDPKLLGFPSKPLPASDELSDFNPAEHLIFDLKVCFNKTSAKPTSGRSGKDTPSEVNIPSVRSLSVYSSELQWVPLPGQENLKECDAPTVVSQTILVNKLAVGDELEARCVAVKGIGRDHAKFSPVSAAYYKFMPIIKLLRPIEGDEARLLQSSFAPGVIGVNHTLGLALRFCILHSTHATFCGYCVPHPLEDKIHLDVQVRSGSANEVLRGGLQCLHDCFVHLKSAFKEALVKYNNRTTEVK